jgi:hemerythrin superfamily protein
MNAISLLEKDHRTVEGIFDQLEKLKGDGSSRRKKDLCEKLVRELSIHSAIEEMIFYPEVKKAIAEAKEIVLESLEEHNVIKWELDAIQSSKIADAHLDAKIKVLKDAVMRHVEEEENNLFPLVREGMKASKLSEIGKRLEQVKKIAPTRPHPRAPSQPPANVVIGMGASLVDRTMDAVRATVRRRDGEHAATKGGHRATKKRAPEHAKRTRAHRAHAH